jgi:hypothetical protein
MEEPVHVPTYELFFILESFQACFAEYVTALRPLAGKVDASLRGCDVYYREDTDVALLALRFDERELDAERLSWVLDFAGGAGLAALDPAMLPDDDRRRFYQRYLEEYPLRAENRRLPEDALQSLAETLGLRVPRSRPSAADPPLPATPPPAPAAARGKPNRADAADAPETLPLRRAAGAQPAPPPSQPPSAPVGSRRSARPTEPARPAAKHAAPGQRAETTDSIEIDVDSSWKEPPTAKWSPDQARAALQAYRRSLTGGRDTSPGDRPPAPGATEPEEPLSRPGRQAPGAATSQTSGTRPLARVEPRRSPTAPVPIVTSPSGAPPGSGSPRSERAGSSPPLPADARPAPAAEANRLSGATPVAIDDDPPSIPTLVDETSRPHGGAPVTTPVDHPAQQRARQTRQPPESRPPGVAARRRASSQHDPSAFITVRFRRGDEWVPARLRSLGVKGAYLACGAPPRLHDDVHIALGLGTLGTVMRGTVVHVTSPDDARSSGAAGFGVLFPTIDSPSRRQLKELLKAARDQGVVLDPPPARRSIRFPVRWPVHLILPDQRGLDLAALDVSSRGMFLSTLDRIPHGALEFYLPTERGGAPIVGRLRAVREVPWKIACARGLHSGFGVEIVNFHRTDDERYVEFVDRVSRRVQRRVIVAAAPERAEALVQGLSAAGYTVSGNSDAGALLRLAECEPRPPDVAILDASLDAPAVTAHRLEQLFAMRKVPVLPLAAEPPFRARAMLDSVLAVNGDAA